MWINGLKKITINYILIIGDDMKKGFTLIEMLGIITVLAILLLLTFPNLSGMLKSTKENKLNNSTNNLKIGAEAYVELNIDKFPELKTTNGSVQIKIQDIFDAGFMKGNYADIDTTLTVTVTRQSNGTLKYYYGGNEIGIEWKP